MDNKKIHIIGIGGIAMSAIAKYFLSLNYEVTGSDLQENELVTDLKSKGVEITIGHQQSNITADLDKVIFSDAIPQENVELKAAKDKNLDILNRSDALALITHNNRVISAAGTHGKTSTSALIAQLLDGAGAEPSFIIGGIVNNFASNFAIKDGDYFVLEGDEYQRSFLKYRTDVGVVTNIEFDHPDIYDDLDDMLAAYQEYVAGLTEYLVTNDQVIEQLNLIISDLDIRVDTVGVNDSAATFNAVDIEEEELSSFFTLEYEGEEIDRFKLPALGEYNIKHALEAIAVGYYFGFSFEEMKDALAKFMGVKRRFETLYQDQEQIIISDYAHHPSEVKAVVDNLAQIESNKDKVVVFQPHQYLRTKRLLDEYENILNQDVTERAIFRIYKVREQVEEEELVQLGAELSQEISEQTVHYFNSYPELEEWLNDYKSEQGVIYLFLGAGDIDQWGREWVQKLE
ncbi:UDP-N-acetylmuramate--L-alanine ligase [Halanaerobacter jeridensis]|uniref:UDP-N-acetylmuramate--L-alanine ligase n=1 Tax=Halanaerobacter jeridensis TaxID=706427 RepID=A0A938XTD1_9FIRM|nr:UDP-N-acetylmuramate--L-alanine ligase [Halanaerobacter jeridensis]MBM7555956.1 UDP-N-acetylmuramate--alanine ligase [Halanaerobacter jeridensis]